MIYAKMLHENASKVWVCGSGVKEGHCHGLVLRLIDREILDLIIYHPPYGSKFETRHIVLQWDRTVSTSTSPSHLAHNKTNMWSCLNCGAVISN